MKSPEFMRLPLKIMPQEIIDKNELQDLTEDGWVYCQIMRGMYGLPHTGLIANKQLKKYLKEAVCHECQFTPDL